MRIAGPATEETWVTDTDGDPVMVITAAPSASLAAELARLLPDLRAMIGTDRPCTVVFDRGGYSPAVFTEILSAGFDLLTYYKGTWTRSPEAAFTTVDFTAPDGATVRYELAERTIDLAVPARPASPTTSAWPARSAATSGCSRASPTGHQTPILTNRTDLSAPLVAYRMANRCRARPPPPHREHGTCRVARRAGPRRVPTSTDGGFRRTRTVGLSLFTGALCATELGSRARSRDPDLGRHHSSPTTPRRARTRQRRTTPGSSGSSPAAVVQACAREELNLRPRPYQGRALTI